MTLMLNRIGRPQIMFEGEGVGSGGGAVVETPVVVTPPAIDLAAPENILFPPEPKKKPEPAAGETLAADWKEFQPDTTKTAEENAAAKAEHDKTKPVVDDKSKPENQVPEDGKYELTMPDGVELDTQLLDAVSPRFKELGLTRAQAQALTDDFVKTQQARGADQVKAWGETVQGWANTAKADKEIGGDKWDVTVKDSRNAVERLGTPALKEYLNATGGGNHPELIRFMAKVGSMIKEDSPASGGAGGSGKPAEAAHILFKNDVPKG